MGEAPVEGPQARHMRRQHHGLEEPAGVGQVPFGGAGIGHGLDALVFGGERVRQRQAMGAHLRIAQSQVRAADVAGK